MCVHLDLLPHGYRIIALTHTDLVDEPLGGLALKLIEGALGAAVVVPG